MPDWDHRTGTSMPRGTIVGITRGSTSSHIARAALDSIAYQTLEVLLAMQKDSGIKIRELRVDGGATVNNLLMQFQSDLLQAKVVRPKITETTALGAAYLAGLAVNYWSDMDEIKKQWQLDRTFSPQLKAEETHSLINDWYGLSKLLNPGQMINNCRRTAQVKGEEIRLNFAELLNTVTLNATKTLNY